MFSSIKRMYNILQSVLVMGFFSGWWGGPILSEAFSWGGRGHHTICDMAVFLVQEKGLSQFLRYRPQVMGHLCNTPDIFWKNTAETRELGNAGHYINPENLNATVKDIPSMSSYLELEASFREVLDLKEKSKENDKELRSTFSVRKPFYQEFGSLWWRGDQFFRRAVEYGKYATEASPPTRSELQNYKHAYNQAVFQMMISMGLMGHFIGDNSMPFHNTSHHDGIEDGHGGIHGYYEDDCVAALPVELSQLVFQKANKLNSSNFLRGNTLIERMKSLSLMAPNEIQKIYKKDPIDKIQYRDVEQHSEGEKLKSKMEVIRKSPEQGSQVFKDIIVSQLAHSALLLAQTWDEIYRQAGRPNLSYYRSYQYPYTVDFIPPDYLTIQKEEGRKLDSELIKPKEKDSKEISGSKL